MSKKHDESKDLRSVSRVAKINISDKTIKCSKSAVIGIHMWGKIDYLTKYCGWHFIWDNSAGVGGYSYNEDSSNYVKETKKDKKLSKFNKERTNERDYKKK